MFYGENLELVRECRSISRKELADSLEVSEQLIWQYETNQTEPSFEMINKLKQYFYVQSQFFYNPLELNHKEVVGKIAYREKTKGSRKKAKMELGYLNFIDSYLDIIEKKVFPDKGIIKSLEEKIRKNYSLFDLERDEINQIANEVREKLELSSNKDLLFKLELHGVYVFERFLEKNVDAYSGWIGENDRPYIILNKGKNPFVRRNFDLAHELGHLLLHKWIDMDNLDKEEMLVIEEQANTFASSFLLPEKDLLKDMRSIERISNPKSYIPLKEKYYVSIQAIAMRVYKLGLMSYQQYQYFWRMINRYKFRTTEPLDAELPLIIPGKVRALLEQAFESRLFVLNNMLDDWKVDQKFLEDLFCFEEGYLDPYIHLTTTYQLKEENLLRFPNGM